MLEKMIAGDTSAINGSYANGRSCFRQFIHEVINVNTPENGGNQSYDPYVFDYDADEEAKARLQAVLEAYYASQKTDADYVQEFAVEIVAVFNATGKSDAKETTQNNFTGTTHPNVKYVFGDAEVLAKYKWLLEFIKEQTTVAATANNQLGGMETDTKGTYAGYIEWLDKMINGDTSAVSVSGEGGDYRTCLRQHIHRIINAFNAAGEAGNPHYNPWAPDYANDAEAVKAFVAAYKANK